MTQNEYLEILFNELGFNRQQRNIYCSEFVNREIKYLDDLSKSEKSILINMLKEGRE